MSERCNCCGQRIQLTRKEVLGKMKVVMLKAAAEQVMETMKNDFMVRDFAPEEQFKLYSNFHHLRFHGIVAKVKKDGNVVPRHWLITKSGWGFLRGTLSLPAYVMVKNNHIESRADNEVMLKNVIYGEPYIQTTFEYFDDDGKPVGWRPTTAMTRQVAML